MTAITLTTRILLVPALAVGLLFSGFVTPSVGAADSTKDCCQVGVAADCCGTTCCEAPAPRQEQSQSDQSRPSNDRPSDGKATWIGFSPHNADLGRESRFESSLGVPTSGSPSLVTQHIRLQI